MSEVEGIMPAGEDEVWLEVPASPEFLRLGRVTASGLASRLGFTYDEIDDLRLALDELCAALLSTHSGPTVRLRYVIQPDALVIEGTSSAEAPLPALNEWSARILSALVDEHDIFAGDRGPTFRLCKRRS